MLSVKTNIATASGSHHRPKVGPTMTAVNAPAAVVEDDGDQALVEPTSCCSLQDSLGSGSTTTNSSMTSSNSGSRMKRSLGKSTFALTSLLAQEADVSRSIGMTSLANAIAADATAMKAMSPRDFGESLQVAIAQQGSDLDFRDSRTLRQALELSLRQARTMRDSCRRAATILEGSPPLLPLNSWVGLPYASLREERPFLYDHMHTHPLSELLTQALDIADLEQMHQGWNPQLESAKDHQRRIFASFQHAPFQDAYESFVHSCCIPLLHAAALRGNVFNCSNRPHDPILYRYQVFPTINVVYPNDLEACQPPTCDLNQGKSVGWLHFHVPLTASQGTSALYCEHFPGREDWHALRCTQVGLGYCWDGARCLSFVPLNTTGKTRVSLEFRILLVRSSTVRATSLPQPQDVVNDDTLCRPHHLQDALTRIPGFYKEVTVDYVGATRGGGGGRMQPDARCGFPFA